MSEGGRAVRAVNTVNVVTTGTVVTGDKNRDEGRGARDELQGLGSRD